MLPLIVQFAAPAVTAKLTSPLPLPPVAASAVVRVSGMAEGVAVTLSGAWFARATVTDTVAVAALKFASEAFVAVTVQVPTPVPVSVVPLIEQNSPPALIA